MTLLTAFAPVLEALGPIFKALFEAILSQIAERLEDHAEYSQENDDDLALERRLRARIERM
jgi:hypothetical protein